jgi:hypothetical protein
MSKSSKNKFKIPLAAKPSETNEAFIYGHLAASFNEAMYHASLRWPSYQMENVWQATSPQHITWVSDTNC